jgi:hemoglobin
MAVAVLAAGCAGGTMDQKSMGQKSLYDRLGGKPAITAVVDDFIGNVAGDGRINKRFANANIPRLKGISWTRSAGPPAARASTRGRT